MIVLLMIVVLVICAIFLSFVFRTSDQEEALSTQGDEVEQAFDVDVSTPLELKSELEISEGVERVETATPAVTERTYESPDTGPGLTAAGIAAAVAAIAAAVVYRRNTRSEASVK